MPQRPPGRVILGDQEMSGKAPRRISLISIKFAHFHFNPPLVHSFQSLLMDIHQIGGKSFGSFTRWSMIFCTASPIGMIPRILSKLNYVVSGRYIRVVSADGSAVEIANSVMRGSD